MGRRSLIISLLVVVTLFIVVGCNSKNSNSKINENSNIDTKEKENEPSEVTISMKVTIDGKQYTIQLEDNETAKSFVDLLPQEFNMSELNGNEKYVYLDTTLPTNSFNPKHINSGDVMLYRNDCLVIFYKSFDTNYSYTKIGHIDNLDDLGKDSVTAKFE